MNLLKMFTLSLVLLLGFVTVSYAQDPGTKSCTYDNCKCAPTNSGGCTGKGFCTLSDGSEDACLTYCCG